MFPCERVCFPLVAVPWSSHFPRTFCSSPMYKCFFGGGSLEKKPTPQLTPSKSPQRPNSRLCCRLAREVVSLALPALVALCAEPVLSIIDTGFVGRLEDAPLKLGGLGALGFRWELGSAPVGFFWAWDAQSGEQPGVPFGEPLRNHQKRSALKKDTPAWLTFGVVLDEICLSWNGN